MKGRAGLFDLSGPLAAWSVIRYLPGFSALRPIRPEKAIFRLPASRSFRISLPRRTNRVQAFFFRFLRVALTHFLPDFRPFSLRSIQTVTVALVFRLKLILVPRGDFRFFLAAAFAVAFGETRNFFGLSRTPLSFGTIAAGLRQLPERT